MPMDERAEIELAERLATALGAQRVPSNEVGRAARLVALYRSVPEARAALAAIARDPQHFVRSGQTRRYASDIDRLALAELARRSLDGTTALRVLGWTRRLLDFHNVSPPAPRTRSATSAIPQTPRGERHR